MHAPVGVKATVPVGVLVVPSDVSVTVAVQLTVTPVLAGLGEQLMVVEVARLLEVIVTLVLLLGLWLTSPV